MMKKIYTLTLLCAAVLFAAACSNEKDNGPVMVAGIQVTPNSVELAPGETVELTTTVTPGDAVNKAVVWSSDKEEVASVDRYGDVVGEAEGNATITATAADGSGVTATCTVVVKNASIKGSWVAENETTHMTITFAEDEKYTIVVRDVITEAGTYSYREGGKSVYVFPQTLNGDPMPSDVRARSVSCVVGITTLTLSNSEICFDGNPHGFKFPLKLNRAK